MVKKPAPAKIVARFAETRVRLAKNRRGTSGFLPAACEIVKAVSRATPASRGMRTVLLPQLCALALSRPSTTRVSPPVTSTAPGKSIRRFPLARLSETIRGTTKTTTAATGMLTRKIHRQPISSTMIPEITTPRVAPSPAMPPQAPTALARSLLSVNISTTSDSAAGAARASPDPARTGP